VKLLFCSFLIIGSLVGRYASAATFYVGTNGDDSNSCIQAQEPSTPKRNIVGESGGVSCLTAANGDILDIRVGTYADNITVVPSGTDWSNAVTIRAHSGETVILTGAIALETTSYAIFQDFVMRDSAIWIGSTFPEGNPTGHHIRIINFDIGYGNSTAANSRNLVQFNQWTHHNEVIGGNFHNAPLCADCGAGTKANYAFYISGDNNLVEDATIHDNPCYGIHSYSDDYQPDRNIYRYNILYNNGGNCPQSSAALLLASGDSQQAYGNIVFGNYRSGIATSHGATNSKIH